MTQISILLALSSVPSGLGVKSLWPDKPATRQLWRGKSHLTKDKSPEKVSSNSGSPVSLEPSSESAGTERHAIISTSAHHPIFDKIPQAVTLVCAAEPLHRRPMLSIGVLFYFISGMQSMQDDLSCQHFICSQTKYCIASSVFVLVQLAELFLYMSPFSHAKMAPLL
jgi:hypothetical protein